MKAAFLRVSISTLALVLLAAISAFSQVYTGLSFRAKATDTTAFNFPAGYGGMTYFNGRLWLKDATGWFQPSKITPAALTKTDDSNITLTLTGSPSTALVNATNIAAGWTGTLSKSRGGLGVALTPNNDDLLQYKSGAWANRTPSQVLTDLGGPFVTSVVITKANGLNGSVSGATTQTITLNTVVDKILNGPDPSSGSGTEGSPYTDTDNTGDIQTQVNALSSGRGGSIKLAAGRYDNSSTITITSPAIDIEALSAGKQENPNGEFEGTTANKIKYSGNGSIFKWSAPTTPRISGHLRKAYLYSPTALQAASVNGSTGVGTKGVELSDYIEQSTFEELKTNNLDFGIYYSAPNAGFFDVINFRQNLILGGRYGMYFNTNGTGVYAQLHNNVIADGLKHNLYVANNSNYYHWSITGNTFARGSGASGILDNPSNVFLGNNYSVFTGNVVVGAGLDYYPTPTQYGADGIIVSGTGNVVSNNIIKDNLGGSGFYGMRITGSTNTVVGNIFTNNSAQFILDTGSSFNDLRIAPLQLAGPSSITDNGDRNFVNGISRNAGDPNSAGNWNGNTKPWNAWIYDATNTLMYNYTLGNVNNNIRLRVGQNGFTHQNLGTTASDVAAIAAGNSVQSISLSTTTAAASTNASRGILGTSAPNGLIIHNSAGSKPIDFSVDGGTTLSGGLDGNGIWTLKRTLASTNTVSQVSALNLTSTGTMADGFGPAFNFYIGSTPNLIAYMFAQRSGADNSGLWGVATSNAGASTVRFNVSPTGKFAFGKGTTIATAQYDFRGAGTTTGINARWEDSGGTLRASINDQGDIVGTSYSGRVFLAAGTTTAGTAPLKFTSGSLLTASEAGAVEFLTDKYYATITTGTARKEIALNDAALTSGIIPIATTNGRLTNWTDPNANTIVGWDDTDGANTNITIGSGLTYTHSTHTLSASGGIGGSTGSTDNAVLRADGTGGSALQASAVSIDDNGNTTFGITSSSGDRDLNFTGSATDVDVNFATKGSGDFIFNLSNAGSGDPRFIINSNSSLTNSPMLFGQYSINTSGTATTGFGARDQYHVENASGNLKIISVIEHTYTDATNTSEDSKIAFKTMTNGVAAAEVLNLTGLAATFNEPVIPKGYTVATLPAGTVGMMAYVTDALTPSFLVTVVGGGSTVTPVFYNGTNWVAY